MSYNKNTAYSFKSFVYCNGQAKESDLFLFPIIGAHQEDVAISAATTIEVKFLTGIIPRLCLVSLYASLDKEQRLGDILFVVIVIALSFSQLLFTSLLTMMMVVPLCGPEKIMPIRTSGDNANETVTDERLVLPLSKQR
ncbi:hypothetical protein QTP88_002293 [Uroleucon formosanum]